MVQGRIGQASEHNITKPFLLLFVEPTSADPLARWSGEGALRRAYLPDFAVVRDFGRELAATVNHGKYAYLVAINAIDKPKRMNEDFANVGPVVFGNNRAGIRKKFKSIGTNEDASINRISVRLGLVGNVVKNAQGILDARSVQRTFNRQPFRVELCVLQVADAYRQCQ